MLWTRVVHRSGLVDRGYVASQTGAATSFQLQAAARYAFGGFRRGISINPALDEVFAASRLPEGGRVPAAYSLIRNTEKSARIGSPLARDPAVPRSTSTVVLEAARQWSAGWGETPNVLPSATEASTTVIVVVQGRDARLAQRLLVAAASADRVVTVAVDVAASGWVVIAEAAAALGIRGRLFPAGTGIETLVSAEVPSAGRFVVVGPAAEPSSDDLRSLLSVARAGRITVPVELSADDTVSSAGGGVVDGRVVRLLAGFPISDVQAVGASAFPVPSAVGSIYCAVAGDAAACDVWVDPTITVRVRDEEPVLAPVRSASGDDRERLAALYAAAGFEVRHWSVDGPSLSRSDGCVRWAVKVASLAGPVGDVWGDTHFGESLAAALRRRGHRVAVDRREAARRETAAFDDVHLIVRGPTRLHPPAHGIRILWIISHPHEITTEELDEFDLVFAASERWAAEATRRFGRDIRPLLECTDAYEYRPRGFPRSDDILFVGKSRDVPRRVVIAPVEAGIPVKVYGPDWAAYIPLESVVAPFVPLSALPEMYERAGVVLNDQWAEMRDAGFPAMRPFDVVASGGRVISEYVDGLQEALGPGVVTYRHEAELVAFLMENDLDRFFPSDTVLRENAERVRREHSFDARAAVLEEAVSRRHPGAARVRGR